jgi:hypothetical protein
MTLEITIIIIELVNVAETKNQQSQNYVPTDGQSASLSWCQVPIWDPRPDFCYARQLRVCRCGAPSMTRGRVCRLQLLLALVSAVVSRRGVRPSPLGTSATNWPIVPAPDDR